MECFIVTLCLPPFREGVNDNKRKQINHAVYHDISEWVLWRARAGCYSNEYLGGSYLLPVLRGVKCKNSTSFAEPSFGGFGSPESWRPPIVRSCLDVTCWMEQ